MLFRDKGPGIHVMFIMTPFPYPWSMISKVKISSVMFKKFRTRECLMFMDDDGQTLSDSSNLVGDLS